jgi:hypothetical protein
MLNPDGVIVGNYRCNLAGVDLNRTWDAPSRKLNPTIFYLKQMIRRFMDDRELILFCDLHGHSRKMNVFMYGCENKKTWSLRLRERVFPRMLWRNASVFSFSDCSFKVSKQKENAGRVVVWRELGLTNSYTMEASFCGADFGRYANLHFSVAEFEEMGHYFCDTILDYCDPDQSKVASTLRELQTLNPSAHVAPAVGQQLDGDTDSAGSDNEEVVKVSKKKYKKFKSRDSSSSSSSNTTRKNSSNSNLSSKAHRNKNNRRESGGETNGVDTKQDKGSKNNKSKNSTKNGNHKSKNNSSNQSKQIDLRVGGGRNKSKKSKSSKDRKNSKPMSINQALAQADAALAQAVESRHLAGSGSAAVKARKKTSKDSNMWRQSAT